LKPYLQQKLTYTNTGKLLDEFGKSVMMEWETSWMEESAKIICKNGGDILNIGFGMGVIDSFIQTHPINTHTIIEAHPDVYNKMIEDGWDKKPNVKIIFSKWQDVIGDLPKYDGIYFDTWLDYGLYNILFPNIKNILKLNGIFSFWNGYSDRIIDPNIVNLLYEDFEINTLSIKLDRVPKSIEQFENGDGYYFNPKFKKALIPIVTHRQHSFKKTLL
jgi:protein arginine N-methyltransferase 2